MNEDDFRVIIAEKDMIINSQTVIIDQLTGILKGLMEAATKAAQSIGGQSK